MSFLAAIPAALSSLVGGAGAATGAGLSAGSVLSGIGTAVSVVGSVLGGVAANQAGQYQAAVAENNAAIAEQNMESASTAAQQQQLQSDNEIAAFIGSQEAQQSASGLSTTGRSQLLTRRSAARIGRLDAQNIRRQGEAEARNFAQQAADFRGEAGQAKRAGQFGLVKGILGAGSSLIGAASPTRSPLGNSFRRNNDPWYGLRRAV